MVVKTYRGLLADDTQERINLQTIRGKVGYRIVKLQIIPNVPSGTDQESVIKIYKTKQTTVSSIINFSDPTLLAVALWTSNTNADSYPEDMTVIFDTEIFNQDIYITHEERKDVSSCNYYLELEVIPLTDHAAEYTTLKDIRAQLKIS